MRLSNSEHESHAWRICEVAPDFRLEDVWALPAQGGADDFPTLLEVMASLDPANGESFATRALFSIRYRVGGLLDWDDPRGALPVPENTETTLSARLPRDLRKYVRSGKLQIQWHGYAVIGPASVTGERFIAAAGLQNHLWDVLDDIIANQGEENSGWLNASLLEQVGTSIPGFNVAAAMADAGSPTITYELLVDVRRGNRDRLAGVPFIELGRRGGLSGSWRSANIRQVISKGR